MVTRKRHPILATACLAVFFNMAANDVSMEMDTIDVVWHDLDETIVNAVKPAQSLTTTTPSFQLDETQLLKKGVTDISDAIHRLPGVTLKDYGGAGGLKTVSVRGLGSAHTSVLYDGLPLSDLQNGAIDLSRYSVDNISSLELVVGDNNQIFIPARVAAAPASLSINSFKISDNKNTDFTVQLKVGSFGRVSPSFDFSQRLSRFFMIGAVGDFIRAKNDYPFRLVNGNTYTIEKRDNSNMNAGHIEVNARWISRKDAVLSAKIYYYDNERRLPGPVIYHNVGKNKEKLRDRNAFLQAEYINSFNSIWKLRGALKFNWAATLYTDYAARQGADYLSENYFQREYYATINLLFTPSSVWSFDYSADYSYNNLNSNLRNDVKPFRNSFLQSITAKADYSRITLLGRLIYSVYDGGAKMTDVAEASHSRLSPSVSLSAKLLKTGLFYGRVSYKNIFRMPTFSEAYFNHKGAPYLKPETTDQLDFGLTYQTPSINSLQYLAVTADLYRNWVKDRIVAVPYNMFTWIITNLNSVHVWGTDVTLNSTIELGKKQQLLLSGTWSWQRAEINVAKSDPLYGKQVAYTPLNSGSFSLTYENPWINMVLHGQGVSARYTDNSNIPQTRLPGYFEFGATLWREFKIKKRHFIECRADILNLLDKQYVVIARYPMPGRSYLISVKFTL